MGFWKYSPTSDPFFFHFCTLNKRRRISEAPFKCQRQWVLNRYACKGGRVRWQKASAVSKFVMSKSSYSRKPHDMREAEKQSGFNMKLNQSKQRDKRFEYSLSNYTCRWKARACARERKTIIRHLSAHLTPEAYQSSLGNSISLAWSKSDFPQAADQITNHTQKSVRISGLVYMQKVFKWKAQLFYLFQ